MKNVNNCMKINRVFVHIYIFLSNAQKSLMKKVRSFLSCGWFLHQSVWCPQYDAILPIPSITEAPCHRNEASVTWFPQQGEFALHSIYCSLTPGECCSVPQYPISDVILSLHHAMVWGPICETILPASEPGDGRRGGASPGAICFSQEGVICFGGMVLGPASLEAPLASLSDPPINWVHNGWAYFTEFCAVRPDSWWRLSLVLT